MNGCNSDTEISDQHEVDVGHKRKLRRSSRKKEKTQFLKMDDTEQEGSKVQPLKKKTKKSHHVPFNKNTSKEKSRNNSKSQETTVKVVVSRNGRKTGFFRIIKV